MKGIDRLVRRNIAELTPYSTARDEYEGALGVFLDANESPYPNGWNRYPDPHQKKLKQRISELKGIPVGNIFLGNGSDEAIDLLLRVFCNPGKDNVVAISPSYGMYEVAAQINDIEVRKVPLGEDFTLDREALLAATDAQTKLMFICSPNNPTGNAFSNSELLSLAGAFDGILVVDEAYIDFSKVGSLAPRVAEMDNVVVLQTMSKAAGMAGLRLGMAFSNTRIIELMSMVKYPYNLSQATQELALQNLEESYKWKIDETITERARMAEALRCTAGVLKVWDSEANFLLVKVKDADLVYERLIGGGVIVRNRNKVPGCLGCLRISIGTPKENDILLKLMKEL